MTVLTPDALAEPSLSQRRPWKIIVPPLKVLTAPALLVRPAQTMQRDLNGMAMPVSGGCAHEISNSMAARRVFRFVVRRHASDVHQGQGDFLRGPASVNVLERVEDHRRLCGSDLI